MFYSRWPRKLGHKAWVTHSEVAHAVSDTPFGPWRHHDVALPARGAEFWDGSCTHNPTVMRIGAKYYLYYMGNYGDGVVRQPLNWTHRNHQRIGVAVANSPEQPQVLLENGRPLALFCAAADNTARDGSFNLQIPLAPPLSNNQ